MSLTNFSGNTLQENFYSGVFARQLKEADILPHIHVEEDAVSGFYNIPTISSNGSSIQDYAATPGSPQGGQTFKDRKITLGKWMLYQTFQPQSLKRYWAPFAPTGTFLWQELPADVQAQMLNIILNDTGAHISEIAWQGNTALSSNLKYFDGFIKAAKTDPEIGYKATGASTTLNSTNILATLNSQLTAARGSDQFRIASYRPDMKIFMNYTTFETYGTALRNQTSKSISYENATPKMFAGIPIVPQAYVPANHVLFAQGDNSLQSNMWMVVNSSSDATTISVDKLANNSEEYFAKMVISAGVNFVRPEAVAIYYTA